jgi:hypothetical protein
MSVRLTIAGLNDLLRTTFLTGRVVMTEGVRALPAHVREEIITKVRAFDDFTEGNDPHGERDAGIPRCLEAAEPLLGSANRAG